jgi:hypothetical protein
MSVDPFEILRPGVWVVVEVGPELKLRLQVERIVKSPATVWCHSRPTPDEPGPELEARPMTMYHGQLHVPVVPASSSWTSREGGNVLTASFRVLPGAIRVQRRGFVRLRNPQVEVRVRRRATPDAPAGDFERVKVDNLGGGGIAFHSAKAAFQIGDAADVEITLGGVALPAKGLVCRLEESGGDVIAGLQFSDIQEGHRDRIMSYIFREQAKARGVR